MSEVEPDRKRRASEMDATVVAPKKKFLAAQAEAAASEPPSTALKHLPSSPGGTTSQVTNSSSVSETRPPSTASHATSYSVRDNAPAGARSADDEENVRFQNSQLYAANQAHRNEIMRLNKQTENLQLQMQKHLSNSSCLQRHWRLLTGELRNALERLGPLDPAVQEGLPQLKHQLTWDGESDSELIEGCQAAQSIMERIVLAVRDCKARYKQFLLALQEKDLDATVKSELEKLLKLINSLEESRNALEDSLRSVSLEESLRAEEVKRLSAANSLLQQENVDLRTHLETAERRLVRSEENFRKLSAGGFCSQSRSFSGAEKVKCEGNSSGGGADGSERDASDSLDLRAADYKFLAEARLEEIKEKDKRILLLESQSLAACSEVSESNEQIITQSALYINIQEQLARTKKECEYLTNKLQQVTSELGEVKERVIEERQKLEQQHSGLVKDQLNRWAQVNNQLVEAKQEIRSLQFKLEQKNACDITSKRADELSENLTKLQEEYRRLRAEHELLKQRPDPDELRREFREKEEKIAKERDVKQIEATDYLDQIRMQERKIAMLMGRNGESGAHGANGVDSSAQREIDALKKDLEGLRNERKDLQRRFLKADRGFNDCNKLYQQVKKEKDALMKDLESLGMSFEEMQEQNVRLLQQMKTKDDEQHELLKQRMRDKQHRELMQQEITALKSKLERAEELVRLKEDCVDKCKMDMEQQRQEFLKKKKEEESEAAVIAAHRSNLQKRELAAIEAKRDADKVRLESTEQQKRKRENLQALQDAQFENNRLLEELAALKSRLQSQALDKRTSTVSADHMELLDHYRSRVKCHCRQDDKARVFPCGHATCVKCCENLIKERSRKCPACSRKFDQLEIRPLFLQGSSDET